MGDTSGIGYKKVNDSLLGCDVGDCKLILGEWVRELEQGTESKKKKKKNYGSIRKQMIFS